VAHEVGALEREYAGEDVDADVVLGPVEHRAEGHDAGVFELPEGELGLGLGPVGGDDVGGGPVVVAGDQDVLAEELVFEGSAGGGVDVPGEAVALGALAVQLPGDDPPGQVSCRITAISASTLARGRRVLPRARVAASSSSLRQALARAVPVKLAAWEACSSGEWAKMARRWAPIRA